MWDYDEGKCVCKDGLHYEAALRHCIGDSSTGCPPNSVLNENSQKCECNEGLEMNEDDKCEFVPH